MESYPKLDALMLGALAFSSAILFAVLQEDIKPIFPNVTLALLCVSITSGVSCQLFARYAFFKRIPGIARLDMLVSLVDYACFYPRYLSFPPSHQLPQLLSGFLVLFGLSGCGVKVAPKQLVTNQSNL